MTASMMMENKMFMKIWKTGNNGLSIKEQRAKLTDELRNREPLFDFLVILYCSFIKKERVG